jgi:hypothetical protein
VAELTHAELTAKLVAEGCLPIALGRPPAKMPVESVLLTEEQRKRADINPGALGTFYPVGDTGVFMQLNGPHARVWYVGIDTDGALETLERALLSVKPTPTFVSQSPHPDVEGMAVRFYRLDAGDGRFVDIEATYPITRDVKQQFIVRLHGRERT